MGGAVPLLPWVPSWRALGQVYCFGQHWEMLTQIVPVHIHIAHFFKFYCIFNAFFRRPVSLLNVDINVSQNFSFRGVAGCHCVLFGTSLTFKAQWLVYVPPGLTFTNSTFCPHSVFMCFVWISEQTAIISLYSIN
jgi:hypothetical protein